MANTNQDLELETTNIVCVKTWPVGTTESPDGDDASGKVQNGVVKLKTHEDHELDEKVTEEEVYKTITTKTRQVIYPLETWTFQQR